MPFICTSLCLLNSTFNLKLFIIRFPAISENGAIDITKKILQSRQDTIRSLHKQLVSDEEMELLQGTYTCTLILQHTYIYKYMYMYMYWGVSTSQKPRQSPSYLLQCGRVCYDSSCSIPQTLYGQGHIESPRTRGHATRDRQKLYE